MPEHCADSVATRCFGWQPRGTSRVTQQRRRRGHRSPISISRLLVPTVPQLDLSLFLRGIGKQDGEHLRDNGRYDCEPLPDMEVELWSIADFVGQCFERYRISSPLCTLSSVLTLVPALIIACAQSSSSRGTVPSPERLNQRSTQLFSLNTEK